MPGALIRVENGFPDTLDLWAEGYFQVEVTTAPSSQKVQRRDLGLFFGIHAGGGRHAQAGALDAAAHQGLRGVAPEIYSRGWAGGAGTTRLSTGLWRT